MQPKKLSLEKELEILRSIDPDEHFINEGSSRKVFTHPDDPNYVVKIAIDDGGLRQNETEIELYKSMGEYLPLAKIHSYGYAIIVMEAVKVLCDSMVMELAMEADLIPTNKDLYDKLVKFYNKELVDYAMDFDNVYTKLCDALGYTEDNYQLGLNSKGQVVSYDYGLPAAYMQSLLDYLGDAPDYTHTDFMEEAIYRIVGLIP